MRIVGLTLVIIMFANTLNGVIDNKQVQIHEEKSENKNIKRKLEEKTNYVILILNQDYNFTINKTSIIEKIIIDGEEENLEQEIKVIKNTEIQIHFKTALSNCSFFFRDINGTIKDKIVSADFSKFDSSNLELIRRMFGGCSSLIP